MARKNLNFLFYALSGLSLGICISVDKPTQFAIFIWFINCIYYRKPSKCKKMVEASLLNNWTWSWNIWDSFPFVVQAAGSIDLRQEAVFPHAKLVFIRSITWIIDVDVKLLLFWHENDDFFQASLYWVVCSSKLLLT